jgi:hypothetical protein
MGGKGGPLKDAQLAAVTFWQGEQQVTLMLQLSLKL